MRAVVRANTSPHSGGDRHLRQGTLLATTVGRDEQGGLSLCRCPMDCTIIPAYGEVCRGGCVQTVVHKCLLNVKRGKTLTKLGGQPGLKAVAGVADALRVPGSCPTPAVDAGAGRDPQHRQSLHTV